MADLTAQIDYAMTAPLADEAVTRIKGVMAEELRRLDPALEELAILDDFNHAYRPDFVLRWGNRRGKRERPVYLRLVAGGLGSKLDLEVLSETKPLFLGLLNHHLDPEAAAEIERVELTDQTGRALISDVSALDALEEGEQDQRVPTVATSALVRGGSGILRVDGARELRDAVAGGYTAAMAGGEPAEVDRAARALEPFLSSADAERFDLQLDLLWLASGGDIDVLENSDRILSADLKPDEWALVLEQFLTREEPSTVQLWKLLGERMDLDDAASAAAKIPRMRHLDAFVTANLERWTARYAGMIVHDRDDIEGWWVTDATLAWGRGRASVGFTAKKSKFNGLGAPLDLRSFESLRPAVRGDRLLTLDARADTTSITLAADDALPSDRVDQVVDWTDQVRGLIVEATVAGDPVTLDVDYAEGTLVASRELRLTEFQRRAARYFGDRREEDGAEFWSLRFDAPNETTEKAHQDSEDATEPTPDAERAGEDAEE